MKRTKLKCNKLSTIINDAENGLFCDSNFMAKNYLIELDNPMLQAALLEKINFQVSNYEKDGFYSLNELQNNYGDIPKLTQLIPSDNKDKDLMEDTGLVFVGQQNKLKHRILKKANTTDHFCYVNEDYFRLFADSELPSVQFYQTSKLSVIKVMSQDEFIGLVMPILNRDDVMYRLICDNAKEVLRVHEANRNALK